MPKRHDMLDSLDSLKMLASDGVFANKEYPWSPKIAPEPQTNATQTQAPKTQEEKLQALRDELDVFRAELQAQDKRQTKRDHDLFLKEQLLEEGKEKLLTETAEMNATKTTRLERERLLRKETYTLEEDQRKANIRTEQIATERIQMNTRWRELRTSEDNFERERQTFKKHVTDEAVRNLKVFMCLYSDDIRYMKERRKLRCIIPPQTTKWFIENVQKAGEHMYNVTQSISAALEIPDKDKLRIHIKEHAERIVVFYLDSILNQESSDVLTDVTPNKLHQPQADDKYPADQRTFTTCI